MRRASLLFPIRFLFIIWVAFAIQFYGGVDLGYLGIYPRSIQGLVGIVTAPMIHGSAQHIMSNSLPLLLLGGVLFYFYPAIALRVFLQCYFFTNILVWIFARSFYHIGASGVVYGLALFLLSYGLFRKNIISIIVSAGVFLLYGGLVYTVFRFDARISWESHLFGAITGFVTAYSLRKFRVNEPA